MANRSPGFSVRIGSPASRMTVLPRGLPTSAMR